MTSAGDPLRTRDGVPIWDGEAASFQSYEELALQWEQGIAWHKRYLCGPRLVSELQGTARRFIIGKRPDWVSFNGGVQYLLEHLRSALGRPQISDMTEHLNRYFKSTKRRRLETMNEYVTRKTEAYARARQAFARVASQYDRQHHHWRDWSWRHHTSSWQSWTENENDDDEEYHSGVDEATGNTEDDPWANFDRRGQSRTSATVHEDEPWTRDGQELLPDFLQGWYLLQDASLDGNERNMVQTALQGDFSLHRVAQELRVQWPEDELRKRDQGARQGAHWQDEVLFGEDDEDTNMSFYQRSDLQGLSDEGLEIMWTAEEEVEGAYAMMEQAKRTLREAREKQKMVKMSRQYYKTNTYKTRPWEKGEKGGGKGTYGGNWTCLRCGGAHRTGQCPDKQAPTTKALASEAAPFVCYVENELNYQADDAAANATGENLGCRSTQDAIDAGMGIIDGGATKTLGSVHALERLMEINEQKHGSTRVKEINVEEQPTFGFGNSSRDTCVSTAKMGISANKQPGLLKIHALDKGQGPILISVETLRALGAIIDFEKDLAVFRNLDENKIVPLERLASGHQLMSLSEDLFCNARNCTRPVPGLDAFC